MTILIIYIFEPDIIRIGKLVDSKFGEGSAKALGLDGKRIVLLNEASFEDQMTIALLLLVVLRIT